jgi:hypothetical protein
VTTQHLQETSQFGVSEWDVGAVGVRTRVDAHAEHSERKVYGLGFALPLPLTARLLQPLTTSQVDNEQLAHLLEQKRNALQ